MPVSLAPNISVAPILNLGGQLRVKPNNGPVLAEALKQISGTLQQISHQLSDAGFSVDQLGNLYIAVQEIREITSRFGYEDACDIQYFSATSYSIPFLGRWMRLKNTSGGSVTLASTPTIATPAPDVASSGPILEILNVGTQNFVLPDHGTLANSGLGLGASTRTIGPRESIGFRYSADFGLWLERTYSAVI
jgi:hypothetical protein